MPSTFHLSQGLTLSMAIQCFFRTRDWDKGKLLKLNEPDDSQPSFWSLLDRDLFLTRLFRQPTACHFRNTSYVQSLKIRPTRWHYSTQAGVESVELSPGQNLVVSFGHFVVVRDEDTFVASARTSNADETNPLGRNSTLGSRRSMTVLSEVKIQVELSSFLEKVPELVLQRKVLHLDENSGSGSETCHAIMVRAGVLRVPVGRRTFDRLSKLGKGENRAVLLLSS